MVGTPALRCLVHISTGALCVTCEQALCLGKKIARKGKVPSSPLDQRPVHRLHFVWIKALSNDATYPSPKLTLTLTSHLGQNVGLGKG